MAYLKSEWYQDSWRRRVIPNSIHSRSNRNAAAILICYHQNKYLLLQMMKTIKFTLTPIEWRSVGFLGNFGCFFRCNALIMLSFTGRLRDGSFANSTIIFFSTTPLAEASGLLIACAFAFMRTEASLEMSRLVEQVWGTLRVKLASHCDTRERQKFGFVCLSHATDRLLVRFSW